MAECLTLKKSNCKNCYKCIRNCPVKSIRFSGNQAQIIGNECILCGRCVVSCPQHAKQVVNEREKVRVLLQSGAPVYVSIAPSFVANYEGCGIESMRAVLKGLGFAEVEETAIGATIVKREYERMIREERHEVMITSCCHTVNLLIQKYYPELLPMLADVLSPMQAHAQEIKKRVPEAKVVFVGPCISKKDEAQAYPGLIDAVLTFEELSEWFADEAVSPEALGDSSDESRARFFPTAGGILKTLTEMDDAYTYLAVDGVRNCMEVLEEVKNGKITDCFIEMNACAGGCIGGPVMERNRMPVSAYQAVARYAGKKDFAVVQPDAPELRKHFPVIGNKAAEPTEEQIVEILRRMGKTKPSDELNCGTCGYNSCRDKARAVFQGKAETSMCLPFLKEKAESFSDSIISHSPAAVIVLNEDLEIQQVNQAAMQLLNIKNGEDALGMNIVLFMDPEIFFDVLDTHKTVRDRRVPLPDYDCYVSMTVYHDGDSGLLVALIVDITAEEEEKERQEEIRKQTMEITDKVVDKQMRIVQEIASLLGETAAETKIALTRLKESIGDE